MTYPAPPRAGDNGDVSTVEEFTVGEATSPAPYPPRARRRDSRAAGWIALAAVAILLGVLVAPTTAPRTVAAVLPWGGLQTFVVMEAAPGADVVALARDAVDRVQLESSPDARMPPDARNETTPTPERIGAVIIVRRDDGAEQLVSGVTLPSPEAIVALDAAAPGEHWVCESSANASTCTSLTSGVVLAIDEQAGG